MRGETITVIRRIPAGVDEGNDPVYETVEESVDNVLVGPPSNANASDSTRPEGIEISHDLLFPRAYTGGPLRGCDILLRGRRYRVVGDPLPVDGGMTPTLWNQTVPVTRSEG